MYPQSIHQWKKDRVFFLHLSAGLPGFSDKNRKLAIRKKELQEYLQGAEGSFYYSRQSKSFQNTPQQIRPNHLQQLRASYERPKT